MYKWINEEQTAVLQDGLVSIMKDGAGWSEFQDWLAEEGNTPEPARTQAQILAARMDAVDQLTDKIITSGWRYPDEEGQHIRLGLADQLNFEGEKNQFVEMEADGLDISPYFPRSIKVWTADDGSPVMVALADLAEYKAFVRAGKAHIRAALDAGWSLKEQLATLTSEELQAWTDPR